ncbi:MAG: hypothetical protein EOO03_01015 [Chitinophagaceae bacterium]|nr:MAG: hypothetical protein EOO03_01015 [Chitinophagaceae bacterium]
MKYFITLAFVLAALTGCTQTTPWKGNLLYAYADNIVAYSFADKGDRTLFAKGDQPFVSSNGDVYFRNLKFPKVKETVRRYTPAGQFKDVLDMSSDNPEYKAALEDYSVIRNTGISGIFSAMSDPRISPNGKYISITIYGAYQNAFDKDCVAVFDVATKKLVKKFDNKYYGTWGPDGKLLMSGSHKSNSTDESSYRAVTPGIFITDKNLDNLQRIDPELDDPSPYHAAISPDGQKVVYVLNGHVWMMNINGTNNKQLTAVDRDNFETYPTFSPDGKFVACWTFKTFERSYFTAIAIVPTATMKPVALTDKAAVWPKDAKGKRLSGGAGQFSWTK